MALLKGEGTHQILYGGADIFTGLRHNRGYLARPDHAGGHPAVLLVHGAEGITASVKSVARTLARHGVAVVATDLFRGTQRRGAPAPPWPDPASVASDLSDAWAWMASSHTPWVRPGGIGVLALDLAAPAALSFGNSQDEVRSIALVSPVFTAEIPRSRVPVLALTGKEDAALTAEVRALAHERLHHAEWVLYGGVGSGLLDESASDYRWDVSEDVVERIVSFFTPVG